MDSNDCGANLHIKLIVLLLTLSAIFLLQSAMTKTSEGKDDDDEDDNDDDEKILVGQDIDPERLKAFNVSKTTM